MRVVFPIFIFLSFYTFSRPADTSYVSIDSLELFRSCKKERALIGYHKIRSGIPDGYYKIELFYHYVTIEGNILDSKMSGQWIKKNRGFVSRNSEFLKGELHGIDTSYSVPTGTIISISSWYKGERHGSSKFYRNNGKLSSTEFYRKGKLEKSSIEYIPIKEKTHP